MSTISKLCQRDRTILTVIHQPASEVFDLFDKLCLLSGRGGRWGGIGSSSSPALQMSSSSSKGRRRGVQ